MISFGSNNLSVVHVCDYVGKAKHPGIVRYDDRSPFRMHGICGNQLHHGFSSTEAHAPIHFAFDDVGHKPSEIVRL